MPLVLAQVNFNVDYTLSKGVITVVVTDQGYSNSIEFYKGKYLGGSDPVEKFIASQVLGCDNLPNCEQNIYLDAIGTGIFEPGDYYFVIWDLERKNAVRKDFVLSFSDLLSCQYNNQSISKDICVSVVTKKLEDKPLYSSFAELEIEFDILESVVGFCFDYMPSSIEILEPSELKLNAVNVSELFNELMARLHNNEMLLRNALAELSLLKKDGDYNS